MNWGKSTVFMLFLAQGAPDISNDQRANGPNDTRKYRHMKQSTMGNVRQRGKDKESKLPKFMVLRLFLGRSKNEKILGFSE